MAVFTMHKYDASTSFSDVQCNIGYTTVLCSIYYVQFRTETCVGCIIYATK